jgi:hypothetical protein
MTSIRTIALFAVKNYWNKKLQRQKGPVYKFSGVLI